jgi:hypothetical protein
LSDFVVSHPAIEALQRLDGSERFSRPGPSRVRLSRYIAGMAILDDRIFVLLDLPYIDIHEYDLGGRLVAVHIRRGPANIERLFGLAIDESASDRSMLVGACSSARECQILRLGSTSPTL